jgi:hypothetical protein
MLVNHSKCDLTQIQMCWKLFLFLLTFVLSRALTNEKQFNFRVNCIVFRLVVYSVVNPDPGRLTSFCCRIEMASRACRSGSGGSRSVSIPSK